MSTMTNKPPCTLIIPAKRRGGVGASETIRLLADTLLMAGQPALGLDLDHHKPDFSTTWPNHVRLFPLTSEEQILAFFKAAPGQPGEVRLVDIPAEIWPEMRAHIVATRWLEFVSKQGTRLLLLIFATESEADARDVIETLSLVEGCDVALVLVHNKATVGTEMPALFRPLRDEIMRRGGTEIILPALHANVRNDVQKKQGKHRATVGRYLAPSEIPQHLDFLEAALFETWLVECRQAIAATDHLFPAAIRDAVRAKFPLPNEHGTKPLPTLVPDFD